MLILKTKKRPNLLQIKSKSHQQNFCRFSNAQKVNQWHDLTYEKTCNFHGRLKKGRKWWNFDLWFLLKYHYCLASAKHVNYIFMFYDWQNIQDATTQKKVPSKNEIQVARVGDRLTWQLSKDHLFRLNLCIKSALILHLFAKKVSWRSLAPNQFDQPTCRNQMLLYAAQTSGFSDKLSWPTLKTSFTLRPQDSTFHSSSKTTM